ncbi:transcription elongation GreA/GreB family factor [Sphingomonas vulcanisoli]|uniref:Transcription elongation GreA/GreB family factor n=1 Tax=Sphingomonas vulcanisoli TaxID=1658060 RepID=A0ABX0TPG6_9SPHN|nr:transcription elongation GreA/GreB family factor [Sphingomonas vulcanisoli]
MSVAFRRESDEEHKEPRFELPIPPGPNLVTPRGLSLIQARVAELEAEDGGDEAALADRARDLRYWRQRLATARPAPPPPEDEVAFGSKVKFRLNKAIQTIEIVGDDEADPAQGRVSFAAPLARAMIGGGVGDMVEFAGREDAIEVLAILK